MNRIDDSRIIERYAYCLCLHVRPGTIFIGVINLAESLLCGILFLVALIYQQSVEDVRATGRSAANSLAVVIYMMCATVSALLLYGVVKSRPSYLMPFFWVRLCDFFFSLPSFLSSLYANPAYASHWEETNPGPPAGFVDMRRVWPPGTAGTHSLLVATCVVLFKSYFLCVVWKCYRYLKMREMILPLQMSYPTAVGTADIVLPPGFLSPPVSVTISPPDYETATKGSSAPPDYDTAVRQQELKSPESPGAPATSTTTAAVVAESSPSVVSTAVRSDQAADQSDQSHNQTAETLSVTQVRVSETAVPIEGQNEVSQQSLSQGERRASGTGMQQQTVSPTQQTDCEDRGKGV